MPKSHPPYAPEFRRQMVELVRAGRTPEELYPDSLRIRVWPLPNGANQILPEL